jgi:hypothetical protein
MNGTDGVRAEQPTTPRDKGPDVNESETGIRVVRVLRVGQLGDDREADAPKSTPEQRLDQLERLRRQTAKAIGYAYPERLQRVLEVAEGP